MLCRGSGVRLLGCFVSLCTPFDHEERACFELQQANQHFAFTSCATYSFQFSQKP